MPDVEMLTVHELSEHDEGIICDALCDLAARIKGREYRTEVCKLALRFGAEYDLDEDELPEAESAIQEGP